MTTAERAKLQREADELNAEALLSRNQAAELREAIIEANEDLQTDIARLKELHQLNVSKKAMSAAYHDEQAGANSSAAAKIEWRIETGW